MGSGHTVLLTGATALVFEVVWTRLLLLSIGATAVAVGADHLLPARPLR